MKSITLFCIFLLFCAHEISAQAPDLRFRKIATKDGLSNGSANFVFQDTYGFLWIGTRQGLNRYDGNSIVQYRSDSQDSTTLRNDYIFDVSQVSSTELLVGTEKGIEILNIATETIKPYSDERLRNVYVYQMKKDPNGSVWAATSNGLFQITTDSLVVFMNDPENEFSIGNNHVRSLEVDSTFVYAKTLDGLNILDKSTLKFRNRINDAHPVFSQLGVYTYDILKSSQNELWFGSLLPTNEVVINRFDLESENLKQYKNGDNGLGLFFSALDLLESNFGVLIGTNGGGIYHFDEKSEHFTNYTFDPKNAESLNDPDAWGIHTDSNGNIWVSTDGGGINQFHPILQRFNKNEQNPFDSESLGSNDVHDFYEDDKFLWVGNNNLGLSRLDKSTGRFFNYPFTGKGIHSLLDYTVLDVEGDNQGNIWIGSYEGGLSKLYIAKNTFTHFTKDSKKGSSLPSNYVSKIVTEENEVWIGTSHGLAMLNQITGEIKSYQRVSPVKSNFSDVINDIEIYDQKKLWVGSRSGLFSFDRETKQIDSTHTVLDSLTINDLVIDNKILWIGTQEGLVKYSEGKVTWYREKDGLSNKAVLGVDVDKQGRVWCTTGSGLNLLDTRTNEIFQFTSEDGLCNDQFNPGSFYKNSQGKMYAGGLQGFESWYPELVKIKDSKPKVIFSNLTKYNGTSMTKSSLLDVDEIELSHNDNFFSIHVFSQEIIEPSKTFFAYQIRELSNDGWIDLSEWKIDFTDLPHGSYTLEVRATNFDGIWGAPSSLLITVTPPWYQTNIAYLSYVIIIISLFVGRDRYLKRKRVELEKQVTERTIELQAQKDQALLDNETISDQKDIIEKSLTERESLLKEIHHRVKNNLQIIASLLYLQSGKFDDEDYRKVLEEGQGRVRSMALIHQKLYENEDLKSIPFDEYLTELVTEIRASFGAEMKKVNININAENIQFDIDTAIPLGLIVNEMATNAFKYAFDDLESGSFSIAIHREENMYNIKIQDDGKGIPEAIDLRKAKSLGLRLVRMLSQQLEGEFQFHTTNGTSFELKFAA